MESSRRENKNRDLAEMEVTAQAGNIAGRVGATVCVVLTLIFRIFTKTYFLSPWVVYFSILTTHTLVKYARLKRKNRLNPRYSLFGDVPHVFCLFLSCGLWRSRNE
ncbi:MAG: hypothetical protein ACLR5X_18820 [Oscillospiraceae bacterium]